LVACTGAMSESRLSAGRSQSPQRRYSNSVDFPLPRPPMIALYCSLKSRLTRPKNFEFVTLSVVIQELGKSGSSWDSRDSLARHACRRASAVGSDHFTHVVCFPKSEWSLFLLSEVWKSPIDLNP